MPTLLTKNGHNLYDMASLYQKAIRRGDASMAGYAANELFGTYHSFLWNRTLIISAEDCDSIITKEIWALYQADMKVNKTRKGYDKYNTFISKAITLLLKAKKNRDADYFSCNLMISEDIIDIEKIDYLDKIPDYTYDVHTLKGKRMGKTIQNMIETEQKALFPKQEGLFDNEDWNTFLDKIYKKKVNQPKHDEQPSKEELKALEKETKDSFETLWDLLKD